MLVRSAVPDDVESIGDVHVRAWQAAYRGEFSDEYLDGLQPTERAEYWGVVLERTGQFGSRLVVAEADDTVIGFACFGPANGEVGRGELYAMNVNPERWRRGVGSALLKTASGQLVQMGLPDALLWTGEQNTRAQSLYSAHGWALDGSSREEGVLGVTVAEVRLAKLLG